MGDRLSFSGLGSGIDFQSIVDTLVAFESRRIDLLRTQQAQETSRLTAFQSFDALLVNLQSQAGALADPGDFDVRSATSSSTAVTATLVGNAVLGTQSVVVNALAQSAQVASQGIAALDTGIGTGTVQLTVGGTTTTVTIDNTNNTLSGLADAINASGAGVTANIISDGSATNPFRLLLTGQQTGAANALSVTTSLTGGVQTPDFTTKRIDPAEAAATNNVAYTGLAQSSGTYTGSANNTILVDIINTGAVGVATFRFSTDGGQTFNDNGGAGFTTATTPVALTDGVSISFTDSGVLTSGDQFTIDVFNPAVQQARDASVTLGSASAGGAPITIASASNTITNLIPGVSLTLNAVTTGPVNITVSADEAAVNAAITTFVDTYNGVLEFLDQQLDFDSDTATGGVLLGDSTLVSVQNRLRRLVTNVVPGLPTNLNRLSAIGITTNIDTGRLQIDTNVLSGAISGDLESVAAIFSTTFTSTSSNVAIVASTAATVSTAAGFQVDITRAASQGSLTGTALGGFPLTLTAANNEVRLIVDGQESGIIALDPRTYNTGSELALELETRINQDPTLGARDVDVTDQGGVLVVTSRSFGTNSEVRLGTAPPNSAFGALGLTGATAASGLDVAGTINGEAATGNGQLLTGNAGNATTDGLALRVTLTNAQLNATGPEATVTITEGIARQLNDELTRLTDPVAGRLSRRENTANNILEDLANQITRQEALLETRREGLLLQFARLEANLAQITAQGDALTSQLANLPRVDTLTGRRNNNN